MNILAFDTSTIACSAALYIDTRTCRAEVQSAKAETFSAHEICPMQHTSVILPMIQSLLDAGNTSLAELDAIAFGCGPGSYTGIRIAASLAQGLAFARSLPVIPISSLAAIAQTAYMQQGYQHMLVAIDARMDQVYWGAYEVKNGLVVPVIADELTLPQAVTIVPSGKWSAVGDGWRIYLDHLVARLNFNPQPIHDQGLPSAVAILPIAIDRFKRRDWVGAAEALPVYLR